MRIRRGGAVKLVVGGTLTMNGEILPRNTLAPSQTKSTILTCGTGGSVWLTVVQDSTGTVYPCLCPNL